MYRQMVVLVVMKVHDYMDRLKKRAEENVVVHVFSNGKDNFDVYASELLAYAQEELDYIEWLPRLSDCCKKRCPLTQQCTRI